MSDPATTDVTLICPCGNKSFYAFPDGGNSYILECLACGYRTEISAGRNVTLSLVEVPDDETPSQS